MLVLVADLKYILNTRNVWVSVMLLYKIFKCLNIAEHYQDWFKAVTSCKK